MIQIYTGDGKGKTTAAVGISIRCAGSGGKVLFCQFLKDGTSSECSILKTVLGMVCMLPKQSFGFTFQMDRKIRQEAGQYYRSYWRGIVKEMEENSYDMLVLDELISAYNTDMVDTKEVLAFLDQKREETEIILTGREPKEELLKRADYITNMEKIRHPFDLGVSARIGIEK